MLLHPYQVIYYDGGDDDDDEQMMRMMVTMMMMSDGDISDADNNDGCDADNNDSGSGNNDDGDNDSQYYQILTAFLYLRYQNISTDRPCVLSRSLRR